MGTRLILGFAVSFITFIVGPALLAQEVGAAPAPRLGDIVDLLTPLVLITLYYLLYRSADDWASEPPSGPLTGLFMFGAILFIDGHGMHLSANSIGHFLRDAKGTDAYTIAYFYDEVLSHFMWHVGMLSLAAALLWRHYQPVKKGINMWHIGGRQKAAIGAGGFLYGLTVGLAAIEGQTVVLDLPAGALIALLFALFWRRQQHVPGAPVFSFLGLGYITSTILMGGWGLYWNGFPQFSDLGIIK